MVSGVYGEVNVIDCVWEGSLESVVIRRGWVPGDRRKNGWFIVISNSLKLRR